MSRLDDDYICCSYDWESRFARFSYHNLEFVILRSTRRADSSQWVLCEARDSEILRYTSDLIALIHSADVLELETFKVRGYRQSTAAMRIGDTYYTGTYVLRKCANCSEPWYTHVNDKCLYEPTNFVPVVDTRHKFLEDALKEAP